MQFSISNTSNNPNNSTSNNPNNSTSNIVVVTLVFRDINNNLSKCCTTIIMPVAFIM